MSLEGFGLLSLCLGSIVKAPSTLARSSSLCRSRRNVVPSSPQSQHALHSPDPDILSVSSCPALYRTEEEEEAIYFSADKQWYGAEHAALGEHCLRLAA